MRYDDYDDGPEMRHAPSFPGTVMTAGVLWIVFGSLVLLGLLLAVVGVALASMRMGPPNNNEGAMMVMACGGLFFGLVGGGFLLVGVQTVRGTARDVLGNGIGSIVISLLVMGLGVFPIVATLDRGPPGPMLVGVFYVVVGLVLTLAGVLALSGRGDYRAWRRHRNDSRSRDDEPRRRRYRDEEDDYRDAPRRRAGEDEDRYRE